ncbi:hypothetical protein C0Q70_19891 [Pomacea canaliculata]|uniref:Ionotropic glutamate receptor L-glutamate and glycine-binding domain-containing protein n=1 Tax=Pomacea canaliculata TaxID=400727 RepID=A0A2T7NE03_POMCA|nr:hypothetical protein C0Q70_19891 [Pomacea canaliculata]
MREIPDLIGPFSSIVWEAFWLCLLDFDLLDIIDIRQLQINNFAVFVPSTETTVGMLKTLLWTPGGRQFSSVAPDISTKTTNTLYPNVNYGLNGAVLKVGTKEWSPLVKKETRQGNNTYIGYCIDLLDIFSEKLNFSYELVLPVDNDWGDIKNDHWTGIMGLFERKEIDLAIGPLSPSEQRANITDWTSSFQSTSEGVFFRQEDTHDHGWIAYLSPFTWEVSAVRIISGINSDYATSMSANSFAKIRLLDIHKLTAFEKEDPDVLSPHQHVHLQKVLAGHYAFVGDESTMGNEETFTRGDIKFLQLYVAGMSSFHVFVQKNSCLKQKIGDIIMKLDEAGVLIYLQKRWWQSESSEGKRAASPSSVTMTTVQGPLYFALGGLILACAILLVERKLNAAGRRAL